MTLFQQITIPVLTLMVTADLLGLFARRGRPLIRISRVAICLLAVLLIASPDLTSQLAVRLGIGRGTDLMLYLMLLVSPFVWFRNQTRHAVNERKLVELARAEAIRSAAKG